MILLDSITTRVKCFLLDSIFVLIYSYSSCKNGQFKENKKVIDTTFLQPINIVNMLHLHDRGVCLHFETNQ